MLIRVVVATGVPLLKPPLDSRRAHVRAPHPLRMDEVRIGSRVEFDEGLAGGANEAEEREMKTKMKLIAAARPPVMGQN